MKTRIHVNKHVIAANQKHSSNDPPLRAKTYQANRKGHEVVIYGQDGREAARVVYRPDKPLSCGARVWIETENEVEVL